jgi:hypothetical protein
MKSLDKVGKEKLKMFKMMHLVVSKRKNEQMNLWIWSSPKFRKIHARFFVCQSWVTQHWQLGNEFEFEFYWFICLEALVSLMCHSPCIPIYYKEWNIVKIWRCLFCKNYYYIKLNLIYHF